MTAGRKREALEKTSSGPVTSRIWAVSNVTMTTPRSTGGSDGLLVGGFVAAVIGSPWLRRYAAGAVADIVNNVSLWVPRPGHTLEDMLVAYLLYPRFTALDVVGTFQVLAGAPGMRSVFVAPRSARSPTTPGSAH